MNRLRCNTCLGEYDDVSPDGFRYFHVCPPVPAVLVQHQDGSQSVVAPAKDYGTDLVVDTVSLPRLNARDENPDPKFRDGKGQALPKAVGLGTTPLPPKVIAITNIPSAAP